MGQGLQARSMPSMDVLTKLYVFADMARVMVLKNQIIDALELIRRTTRTLPALSSFHYVWGSTHPNDPIRSLMVDWLVWRGKPGFLEKYSELLPAEFRLRTLVAMRKVIKMYREEGVVGKPDPLADTSNYYEKEDNSAE